MTSEIAHIFYKLEKNVDEGQKKGKENVCL